MWAGVQKEQAGAKVEVGTMDLVTRAASRIKLRHGPVQTAGTGQTRRQSRQAKLQAATYFQSPSNLARAPRLNPASRVGEMRGQ